MKLSQEQLEFFNREGWLFLPELFQSRRGRFPRARGGRNLRRQPAGGLAREERRAAHGLLPPISTTRRSAFWARIRA